MEKKVALYNGNMVMGVQVSDYGLKKGYLDYGALANIVGPRILSNELRAHRPEDWEMVNGEVTADKMIFQDWIISDHGATFLFKFTDEFVFYNEDLDIYIWGVCHYGTGWDYVLTDFKLVEIDLEAGVSWPQN